ncbi:DUF1266 domain-containing protein [Escherichia coli]|uniref:DUF1266 domain-containing protein n=1 Tax=Escherichia coli TaxID=562 RepID=UPI000C347C14|nr:DUF1266 domain-containing protein [Escherichia coli]EFH5694332.1 DUF1266 domain-containing protein [Escherichia coli]EFK8584951.1 DUF1266 domain-containing protein [Escherichia coli]EFK8660121.1 DUF1266 domain-containing protein [Escherichia coli]EGF7432655.1 DUF1266 domain-containing protein [Escherichia coli]EGJ7503473.1 DUF1266 domain-containing protein [Escherichia coli]
MKKVLLQNHPGSEKYSFNGWEIFNSNFERMIKENKAMLLCKWGFYITCTFAALLVCAGLTANGLSDKGKVSAGYAFLYLLIMAGLVIRAGFRAKKEQLHYYKAKGIEPLSEEKLQALRLIAPNRFYNQQWSESLEFWPRKPALGTDTFRYHVLRFESVGVTRQRRKSLDDSWGIVDSQSYIALMEYFLSGEHGSNAFKEHMEENPQEVIAMLSKVKEFPEDYLYDCTIRRIDKSSPRLIWAAEIAWIIGLTCSTYQNGTIEEDLAWHYILTASKKAYELFESEEEFHRNSLMGSWYWHAFCYRMKLMDAELEEGHLYDVEILEHYRKKCRWPIKNLPWGTSSN